MTPLVKLPFKPYHDKDFNVDVRTEQEDGILEKFRMANQEEVTAQFQYLQTMVNRDSSVTSEPLFQFLTRITKSRRLALEATGEWLDMSKDVRNGLDSMTETAENVWAQIMAEADAEAAAPPAVQERCQEPVYYESPIYFMPAPAAGRPSLGLMDGLMRWAYTEHMAYRNSQDPDFDYIREKAKANFYWDNV